MLRLVRSIARSISVAIRHDPEVERLIASHPRTWSFLSQRLDRSAPLGLRLTIGAAISGLLLFLFFGVVEDLVTRDPLVEADLRIVSLVQMFRAPAFDNIMLFFTYLGNWQIVFAGAGLLGIGLALCRRWIWLGALVVSIGVGEALVWGFKTLFHRARPDLVNALVSAQGPSFPSGHAFVAFAFYGLVAWFAISRVKSWWLRALLLVAALTIALGIGFSRIYLGVHWPSDVLASYVLGGAWLAAVITALTILEARVDRTRRSTLTPAGWAIGALLVLIWSGTAIAFYQTHPLQARTHPLSITTELAEDGLVDELFAVAPRFSEDIVGSPMEPINVILTGTETDIAQVFERAGWKRTDSITVGNAWRLLGAELLDRPYPEAPGIPSFWFGRPNRSSFERPTGRNTARERHHLHMWDTHFRVAGTPVWVGTVHLDVSAITSAGVWLPIHQIDPAVDRERDALRTSLSGEPCVIRLDEEAVTEPMMGQNAVGSPFFTDGKAIRATIDCG